METLDRYDARGSMNANRSILLPLIAAVSIAVSLPATVAQAQTPQPKPGTSTAPAQAKPQAVQKPAPAAPAQKPPAAANTPVPKQNATEAATPAKLPVNTQPNLLGQYDNWAAYWASPDGRKICFAAARPASAQTRSRPPTYLFITSRPQDKVKDEVSAIASFPFKSSADATATVGGKNFVLATQADGAWVKNSADETKLIEAMRKGGDLVLRGTTDRGLQSTDTFSLKGLPQALDRIARECK
jgi:Invasion associated locus B (IalB) protein